MFLRALMVVCLLLGLAGQAQATLSTTSNIVTIQGNGATTTFTYNFLIPNQGDLIVYLTTGTTVTVLTPTQYTVTGLGNATGGSVTYPLSGSPISSGTTITIERFVPYVQTTSIANQGPTFKAIEGALDYLTMQTQQLNTLASGGGGGSSGTITGVSAGTGLNGGGSAGTVTLNLTTPIQPGYLPLATPYAVGAVKPDNSTITVNASGVLSVPNQSSTNITVASCKNASGDGAIIQAAVNTGQTVFLSGPCNLDSSVTFNTPSQLIYGAGADQTVLNVSTVLSTGAFIVNTGNPGPGPIFQDFSLNATQVDTATRSLLTAFTPAIYAQNQTRLSMFRVKLSGGWLIGIDGRGNSGGWVIDDLKEAALEVGMWFDGSGDTNRINNWHFWPYGPNGGELTTNQQTIFTSANTSCTPLGNTGSGGAIALYSGQAYLQINDSLSISGQGWCFFASSSGPGSGYGPIVQASNAAFDTFNGIVVSGGEINITTAYFTLQDTSQFAIKQSGGAVVITDSLFYNTTTVGTVVPAITFTGGKIRSSTGLASLTVSNSTFDISGTYQPALLANSTTSSGEVVFVNNVLHTASTSSGYASSPITVNGTNTPAKIIGNQFDAGNGSGNAITIQDDNWNTVSWNTAPAWLMSFPASTHGIYDCNNSASSVSCGSGSGSISSVSSANALIAAVTSTGAVTLTANETPTFTGTVTALNLQMSANNGVVSTDYISDFSNSYAMMVQLTSPAVALVIGSPSDTGIAFNSSINPNSSAYTNGTAAAPWSNTYTAALTITGITGVTEQCLHANTSGVVTGTGSDCGSSGGSITSVIAGTNLTGGGSSGAVTLNLAASLTGMTSISGFTSGGGHGLFDNSSNVLLGTSGGAAYLGNSSYGSYSNGNFLPSQNDTSYLGFAPNYRWLWVYTDYAAITNSMTIAGYTVPAISGVWSVGDCLTAASTTLIAGTTPCGGTITAVNAGTNLTGGGSSGSVTLNVSSAPTFSGNVTANTFISNYMVDATSTYAMLTQSGSGLAVGSASGSGIAFNGNINPNSSSYTNGTSSAPWASNYAKQYYTGASGTTAGVSCSGALSGSAVVTNGIVTHC